MSFKILVTGYPGTGKTSLSYRIKSKLKSKHINVEYFNEDIIAKENFLWVKGVNEEIEVWKKLIHETTANVIIIDTIRYDILEPVIKPDYVVFLNYKTTLTEYILQLGYHGEISVPKKYNIVVNNISDVKNVCNYIVHKILKKYEI